MFHTSNILQDKIPYDLVKSSKLPDNNLSLNQICSQYFKPAGPGTYSKIWFKKCGEFATLEQFRHPTTAHTVTYHILLIYITDSSASVLYESHYQDKSTFGIDMELVNAISHPFPILRLEFAQCDDSFFERLNIKRKPTIDIQLVSPVIKDQIQHALKIYLIKDLVDEICQYYAVFTC